jgi:hypothetical protein
VKRNDKVSHVKFGQGVVISAQDGKAVVAFGDGERQIAESFLTLEEEGEEEIRDSFAPRKGPLLMSTNFRFSDLPPASTRTYEVNRWQWTRCPINCDAYQEDHRCGHQRAFPIPSLVRLSIAEDGTIVRAACSEGRKGEKGACQEEAGSDGCSHVRRAMMHLAGEEPEQDSPLRRLSCDFRLVMRTTTEAMPKCPNCNSRGMVSRDGDRFVCRSGTCMRPDSRGRERPFRFRPGAAKLTPRWAKVRVKEGYGWD